MDDFIQEQVDSILALRGVPFTKDQLTSMVKKICSKANSERARMDLTKLLFKQGKATLDFDKKEAFINNFVALFEAFLESKQTKEAKKEKGFLFETKYKDIDGEEFPELEDAKLSSKRKKYNVLDTHYGQELKDKAEPCFCYGSKHPLVGNCLRCGRVICLQEGEKSCIECNVYLVDEKKYSKMLLNDPAAAKAKEHKDKLLRFQADFYSKMEVIDDYTDWYELANNTWISEQNREKAKMRDEMIDQKREKMDFNWKVNLLEGTFEAETEVVDEKEVKEDIKEFYNNEANRVKLKEESEERKEEIQNILSSLKKSIPTKHLAEQTKLDPSNVFFSASEAFNSVS